jgi:hypothetical protein
MPEENTIDGCCFRARDRGRESWQLFDPESRVWGSRSQSCVALNTACQLKVLLTREQDAPTTLTYLGRLDFRNLQLSKHPKKWFTIPFKF